MRTNYIGFLALCGAGLFVLGCGDDGNGSACPVGEVTCDGVCIPEIEPTLDDIQASVFDISCTASSCHGSNNPQAGLELTSVQVSSDNLIDVDSEQVPGKNRVTPSDVAGSYIFNKITGENIAPGTQQMPLGFDQLCNAKIEAVEAWIAVGAPE